MQRANCQHRSERVASSVADLLDLSMTVLLQTLPLRFLLYCLFSSVANPVKILSVVTGVLTLLLGQTSECSLEWSVQLPT